MKWNSHQSRSEDALRRLERAAEDAPLKFRARAYLRLGAINVNSGDIQTGSLFYNEALKLTAHNSVDPVRFYVLRNKAAILGVSGDNIGSLKILKSIAPLTSLIKMNDPALYHDYQNSVAVELTQLGRFEEAKFYINQALASPFACHYPEWHATRQELQEAILAFE